MIGEKAFNIYHSVNYHFTSNYDCIESGFLTNRSLLGNRDFHFFKKLESKYDKNELIYYFVGNIVKGNMKVSSMNSDSYSEFLKDLDYMETNFRKDILFLKNKNIIKKSALLSELKVYNINILSIMILNELFSLFHIDKIKNNIDYVLLLKILKLRSFVNVDKEKYLEIYKFL